MATPFYSLDIPSTASRADLLATYVDVARDLAFAHVERGEVEAHEIGTRWGTFERMANVGITERMRHADNAAHHEQMETVKMTGRVRALEAQLRVLDVLLAADRASGGERP